MRVIPNQAVNIGGIIVFEDKKLEAKVQFTQGAEAKVSGYNYFMPNNKGVLAFEEV